MRVSFWLNPTQVFLFHPRGHSSPPKFRGSDTIMSDPHLLGTRTNSELMVPGPPPVSPASDSRRQVYLQRRSSPIEHPSPSGWLESPHQVRRGVGHLSLVGREAGFDSAVRVGRHPPPNRGRGLMRRTLIAKVRANSFSILISGVVSGSRGVFSSCVVAASVRASGVIRVFNNLYDIIPILNVPSGGVGWV